MSAVATDRWMIPGDAPDPWAGKVGKSLALPYGVWGRLPERTVEDVVASVKKHVAEVLDEIGEEFLTGVNPEGDVETAPSWEVRFGDEQAAFRFPFARVWDIGPELVTNENPRWGDHTQTVAIHLYPYPAPDSERAILGSRRLKAVIGDALEFGAARGLPWAIPLWDFGGVRSLPDDQYGLYGDTESRQPWDYLRVTGLSIDRLPDPEDDRNVAVVVTFRAQWRRVPSVPLGRLVESVRMTAHPR